MQFASFDLGDPLFDAFGLRLSVHVHTLENLYGLDAARCERSATRDAVVVHAAGLAFAGQQELAAGSAELRVAAPRPASCASCCERARRSRSAA